jgi:hypothetical protein
MKVLGAGLPRTGTSSFKLALEQLGCGPCYHNMTLWERPAHVDLWQAVADGKGPAWQEIFAGFGSAVDWPASIYYEPLMQAYPEAKIVLTVRDADRWYDSMTNTILWALQQDMGPGMVKYSRLMTAHWERIFEGGINDRQRAVAMFHRLNREVQERVPSERLLVYEVQQGWEPLCRFLDIPVPADLPFPRVNDTGTFRQQLTAMRPEPART